MTKIEQIKQALDAGVKIKTQCVFSDGESDEVTFLLSHSNNYIVHTQKGGLHIWSEHGLHTEVNEINFFYFTFMYPF